MMLEAIASVLLTVCGLFKGSPLRKFLRYTAGRMPIGAGASRPGGVKN